MSASDETIELSGETLSGDLRDVMLTHIRAMETPWSKLSERDQEDKIYAITNACETIVRRAVSMIAADGREVIHVEVPKFTVKDKIVMEVVSSVTTPSIEHLADNRGRPALLMFVAAADYIGQKAEAKADPDEPGLPIDDRDDGNVGDVEDGPEIDGPEFPGDEE